MKLYFAQGSSSLAAHIVLLESGLPFTTMQVDEHSKIMADGGDYRRIQPLGYVPALQLPDSEVLTEGVAIMQFIADHVPSRHLAPPAGSVARARLQAWLNFLASEVHKSGFTPLFNPAMPEAARQIFRTRLATRLAHLDQHLASAAYLLGAAYSVADAHCFVVTGWAPWVDVDLSPYAHLRAYRERLGARPAIRAALAAEGLIPWPDRAP